MRHLKRTAKLGRTGQHRNAMLVNLVVSLVLHKRITTTVSKARAARSFAEKLITLGKRATLHGRRLAIAQLRVRGADSHLSRSDRKAWRDQSDVIRILFDEIAPGFKIRRGGYTRIVKAHQRRGDAAEMVVLEWVDSTDAKATLRESNAVEVISRVDAT